MRLTLRTLLAHIDNNLPSETASEIASRIEESEFARELVRRTRDVSENLRLDAPSPERGEGPDPNTVSEYLDNCLPPDRVHDFERACIDSDVQLAEVACAHQILALILSVPAEIDVNQKQRMYRLPQLVAAQEEAEARQAAAEAAVAIRASSGHNGSAPPPTPTEPEKAARPKPEIPEYLREAKPRRPQWRVVLGVGLALIVLLAILGVTGQLEPGAPVARFLGMKGPQAESDVSPAAAPVAEPAAAVAPSPAEEASPSAEMAPSADESVEAASGGAVPEADVAASPAASDAAPSTAPLAEPAIKTGAAAMASAADEAASPAVAPANPPLPPPPPTPAVAATLPAEPDAAGVVPSEAAGESMEGASSPPAVEVASAAPLPDAPPPVVEEGTTEPVAVVEKPAAVQERLGRLVSDNDVLLRYDAESQQWERFAVHASLTPAYPLVALPAYRPQITVSSGLAGCTLELVGPTWAQLLPTNADKIPGLSVVYGRVVVRPIGDEVRLRLEVEDRSGVLAFEDPESTLAIDVHHVRVVGVDPRMRQAPVEVRLLSVSGTTTWTEGDKEPVPVTADSGLTLLAAAAPESAAVDALPKWITDSEIGWLDRRAAPVLEEALDAPRPVNVILLEMAEHRQKEVRWLAARALAETGQFKPLLGILSDTDQKTVWPEAIEHLERYLAIAPSVAQTIFEAMQPQLGQDDANLLFRMLWGYTSEQASGDGGRQLVDALASNQLAIRVVAAERLRQLTDGVHLGYRPEDDAAKRAPAIQRWRERLVTGLVPTTASAAPEQ